MKRFMLRFCSFVTIAAMTLTLLSGCNKKDGDNVVSDSTNNPSATTKTETNLLPVKNPITIKCWAPNGAQAVLKSYNDIAMYKELEKKTGVKVDFIHPAQGQEKEVFNMMIASGDQPDIIENISTYYSGGLEKAYVDGVIVDLKPLMDKHAPNLTNIYKEYPEARMGVETLDGRYFVVPMFKGSNAIRAQYGLITRKDYLDAVGLEVPNNLQEFEAVLKAYKDKLDVKIPLQTIKTELQTLSITGAFGLNGGGYQLENGKVTYWASSPKYKDYITTLSKWYKEGWIDPEYPVVTSKTRDARVTNGEAGIYWHSAGSGFLSFLEPGKKNNPKFDLVAIPYLDPEFSKIDPICSTASGAVSITAANKNKDITMEWLDFLFTKEGNLIANFGVEGESYKMENGYPKYTEVITKNPDGRPMGEAGRFYARSFGSGPFVVDKRYGEQFWALPQQKDALATWSRSADATAKAKKAVYGNLTPEETQATTSKMNDITTYVNEWSTKFIMGVEPLSKVDEFQAQLKKLGIDDIVKLQQGAHDKFLSKFPEAANPKNVEMSDYFMK